MFILLFRWWRCLTIAGKSVRHLCLQRYGNHRRKFFLTAKNAAGRVVRRRVREGLEAQGWQYLRKEGRNLISLCSPEGVKHYLLCGYGKYNARTVLRNVATLKKRLKEECALLIESWNS